MDFWPSDPSVLDIILYIFGVLGFLITSYAALYAIRRNRKTPDYAYTHAPVINDNRWGLNAFEAAGYPVYVRPATLTVRLVNTGALPIAKNDLAGQRITVQVVGYKHIANYEENRQSSPDVLGGSSIRFLPAGERSNVIAVQPELFNPGEWAEIDLFVHGPTGEAPGVIVEGRITGQTRAMKELRPLRDRLREYRPLLVVLAVMLCFTAFLVIGPDLRPLNEIQPNVQSP